MTNRAVYEVKTENGYESVWTFTEYHTEGDYGNGNYISVVRGTEVQAYVDMRYQKYVFESFCTSYISLYYGENLLSCKRV